MKIILASLLIAGGFAISATSSHAATYDEMVNGNLSSNNMSPTFFAVTPGKNTLRGGLSASWDFVTFTVPAGYALGSLTLDAFTTNSGGSGFSILAIAPGATSPYAGGGGGADATGLLGFIGFRASHIGQDLLPAMGAAPLNATGFTPPLTAGKYTLWIQDYSETITYQFSLNLEAAVPPTIRIAKKKLTVRQNKVKIAGTVDGRVTTVTYRVGTKGAFRAARGLASNFNIPATGLKPGKNIVTVQATGVFGTSSTKVTVTYKKR